MHLQNGFQGDNRWWKYLIALASIIIAFAIGQAPILLFSYYKKNQLNIGDEAFEEYTANMNYQALGMSELFFFGLLLLSFPIIFVLIAWLLPLIHQRNLLSFLTGRARFDFKRFLVGLSLWMIFASIFCWLLIDPNAYFFNFQPTAFFPLLLIALLLIPLQTAVEELLFRGYILQGIYQFSKRKWLTLILVSILFALMHVFNPEFENGFYAIAPAYLILSFFFGIITIIDDGLELPIGIHTGNNLFVSILLSSTDGAVRTPSLFKTSVASLVEILPILLIALSSITFLSLFFIYKWNWKRTK